MYILKYIVLPSSLNLILATISWKANRSFLSDTGKTLVVLCAMIGMCTVAACVHGYFLMIYSVFIAPVVLSCVLDELRITRITVAISVLCMLGSIPVGLLFDYTWSMHIRLANCVASMALMGVVYVVCYLINLHEKERDTLLCSTVEDKERMQHELKIDAMTGLYNHTEFYACLEECSHFAYIGKLTLTIAVIDIDHFKIINDSYGHSNGDKVLLKVSEILKTQCHEYGSVFRYGGEEFAVVFPEIEAAEVKSIMDNIREICASVSYDFKPDEKITVSVGIYSYHGDQMTPEEIFVHADDALYQAKHTGRNKCVIYSPENTP